MAWNPSPEVAAARDFGKKFNYDKVYIIAVSERRSQFEIISYGETKQKCDEAKKYADELFNKIATGEISVSD